jgi:hypothetical protein
MIVPANLKMIQNTALGLSGTNGQTAVNDDTSVANVGNDVFYVGDFYAALSTDGGASWSYIDPASAFPASYDGFCCDQQVIYVPSVNLVFWALLYLQDSTGNNEVRLAVANPAGLESGTWTYFDFTNQSPPPSCLTDPSGPNCTGLSTGIAFDYPQIAYSANDFYLTANLGTNSQGYMFSIIFRCPLADLAGGQTNNCDSYYAASGLGYGDAFTPVSGASTTMYWADHADLSHLAVYAWTEGRPWESISVQTVEHSQYPTNFSCPSPDGTDMCAGDNSWNPIHGGWLNGNVLAFQWDAGKGPGGLGTFPYPYIHVVEIDTRSMSLIDEPVIWSNWVAYAYAASAINQSGNVALSLAYSGNGYYPGSALMIRYSPNPTSWQPVNLLEGTNGPPAGNDWGDYLTVRTGGDGETWVATAYVLQGACTGDVNFYTACPQVQPRFLWFALCNPPPGPHSGSLPSDRYRIYLPLVGQAGCLP